MKLFLFGAILGLIIGFILGAFVIKTFNVTDYAIDGKYKTKKGGKIDLKNILESQEKKKRFRLFKRKK
jgi:hypothetical protein